MSATLQRTKTSPAPAAGAMERFLASGTALPTAPAIAGRILDAVRSEDGSTAALAAVIATDPALTARVLSVANSALYALPRKVDRLDAAISLLGTNALKNIALSFVVMERLGEHSSSGFDFEEFIRRALTGAAGAELAAKLVGYRGDVFAGALLRDVGSLVFSLCAQDEYARVLQAQSASQTLCALETHTFGFDHQELGSEVLRRWGLPDSICLPIRWHHEPDKAGSAQRQATQLISLADHVAAVYHGNRGTDDIGAIKRALCGGHGIAEAAVDAMIDQVAERMREAYAAFELDASTVKPYSQLLQEANQELRKLNLTYEQLVIELRQSQERAERLAADLRQANAVLREMATRDGLTGLFNHRTFQELLKHEVATAQRYGRVLSLVLFDLDHFKKVNDVHGHPAGDAVLRDVARMAADMVRSSDIVARYGGEEFALVLPETDMRGAVVLAEKLRRTVEAHEVVAADQRLRVTVSIGVCTWRPSEQPQATPNLVEVADKALYAAKNSGRNRVCFGQ